jgi:hypothetical protein
MSFPRVKKKEQREYLDVSSPCCFCCCCVLVVDRHVGGLGHVEVKVMEYRRVEIAFGRVVVVLGQDTVIVVVVV